MRTESLAVVGAGRIGIPWGVVVANKLEIPVTFVDIDRERVERLNEGTAPFSEPQLDEYLSAAVEAGLVDATTDPSAVCDSRFVAVTINAERNSMRPFLETVAEYARRLSGDQVVINRTTLPVGVISRMQEVIAEHADGDPSFVVFPERLAEGKAISEVQTLPKVVGVTDTSGRDAMEELLADFDCPVSFTDPETAMFVKLIDNTYRDALFAIANQIGFTADQLGLDAGEAISLANHEYPRNDIPRPGTVGGKCLPKDPHFLTDEQVCSQPTTPDLFSATRRTNARIPAYVATEVLKRQPTTAAVLGLSYKRGVGDTYNSPAVELAEALAQQGVTVSGHDPHIPEFDGDISEVLTGVDVVVLAVNHAAYDGIESQLNEATPLEAVVYDLWGTLDRAAVDRTYDGFGIDPDERETGEGQIRFRVD